MTWKKYQLYLIITFIGVPALAFLTGFLVAKQWPAKEPTSASKDQLIRIFVDAKAGTKTEIPESGDFKRSFPGPLFVTVIHGGQIHFRCSENASPLGKAVQICRDKLLGMPGLPKQARIRVDLELSRVKIPDIKHLRRLLILPGIEALAGEYKSEVKYILPDEMYLHGFLTGGTPLKFIKDLRIGIDFNKMENELYERLGGWPQQLYRVKLMSIVNGYSNPYARHEVLRGNLKEAPPVTADTVYKAAIAGGDYMLRSLITDSKRSVPCRGLYCRVNSFRTAKGQFVYNYWLTKDGADWQSIQFYNLPRHAGTTYALANLYRITKVKRFGDGAKEAIAYLNKMAQGSCKGPGFRCVAVGTKASLGSSALALVAITEYVLATNDSSYDEFGKSLAEFMLYMQRSDGSFKHHYDAKLQKPDEITVDMYYSGEASLALAKAYNAWKDPRYLKAAEKGVDWLTGKQMKQLPFRFGFGEEHWTCQAAGELHPHVKKAQYVNFCINFARYIGRQQWRNGETAFNDYVGTYGFSPVIPAHSNGAGSRTEANVSTFKLAKAFGKNTSEIRAQIKYALGHIIRVQRNPENCWLCANPEYATGAVPTSPVQLDTRIDTVQHTTSGLIRAWASIYK